MTSEEPQSPGRGVVREIDTDLGFGAIVSREAGTRLLNRNGSFNVRREGLPLLQSLSAYHYFLTVSWPRFLGLVVVAYVAVNGLFALFYLAAGDDALTAFAGHPAFASRFWTAFFFSVQTLATIGFGSIAPHNFAANVIVAFEALVGLLAVALVAGIVFARFSRPVAQIRFSEHAVVAPYRGITALMFRIVNERSSEIVNLRASLLMARRRGGSGEPRQFANLALERDHVVFFPLAWTIVHPIDEGSPLFGISDEELQQQKLEFLILLDGFDETSSQTVHARSSYTIDEVLWGARFSSMFNAPRPDGTLSVDIRKLNRIEKC